ncbi:MAG: DUF975 family protein [Vagococcus sp.]|uniref:DUF975 family protein n=1 Tax=Vagococcus sp. TaxID=1933889 RepID=UPI002FC9BC4C
MYKTSSQLKREAKDSLRGRWKDAVLLNLIPSIIQIIGMFFVALFTIGIIFLMSFFMATDFGSSSKEYSPESSESIRSDIKNEINDNLDSTDFEDLFDNTNVGFTSYGITPIISFVLSFLTIGIAFTFLDVIRKREEQPIEFKDAFRVFNGIDFVPVFLINLLMYIFKTLWSFALVIPAFVKHYSYSQSNFIYKDLAEHSDVRSMGATTFITESRSLMKGHKGRLFWIDLSFIGWYLLGFMTFGIAMLWVNPYMSATKAAFYNDLAKDRFLIPTNAEAQEDDEEWTSF